MEPIERDSLSASYLFENMRWSPVKVGFMANAFDPDYYPSALFRIVRLRSELTAEDMKAAVQARASDDFEQDGQAQNGGSDGLRYVGKGYVANLQAIEDGTFPEAPPLGFSGPASASADALAYLSKIIAFCSEKGIELTLFQTPLLPGATEWVGDYAAYHDFIKGSADDAGVVFIDFNYLKPEIITYEDGMFSDLEHATESFAQRFSFVFAGLVAGGNGKTVSDGSFFTSYDTYRGLYNAVASTWVTEATDRGARVSSVGTATPEYRVAVLTDDDNMDTVRSVDWQTDDEAEFFPLKPGDYIVTVEARPRGDEDAAPKGNWVEIHVD
jgi:hypothetical protein